jgi:hypothetical protein
MDAGDRPAVQNAIFVKVNLKNLTNCSVRPGQPSCSDSSWLRRLRNLDLPAAPSVAELGESYVQEVDNGSEKQLCRNES